MNKILIVEDEELLSSAFSTILKADGYKVEVARDGLEALELIPKFQPQLVLLDLMMPRMGGVEFLQKLSYEKSPIIVVLSNLHDVSIIEQVKKLGAVDYFVKSEMTPARMSEMAKSLLLRRRPRKYYDIPHKITRK